MDDNLQVSKKLRPYTRVKPKIILNRRRYVERPPTPPLDNATTSIDCNYVKPIPNKIGFLGLGPIGRGIVKNLIKSGHNVTVWNKSPINEDFIIGGATICMTPVDVIESCDIILSLASDPQEAKKMASESFGIFRGLELATPSTKSFIELSTLDQETFEEIARGICQRGINFFLEAPVIGSRKEAEDGDLVMAVAGDLELFRYCKSIFQSMCKKAAFIVSPIGTANKMTLILNMFRGSAIAALGEAVALIDSEQLCDHFFEMLEIISFGKEMFQDKGKAMVKNNLAKTEIVDGREQKNLILALELADAKKQPLIMAGAVKETLKRAKKPVDKDCKQ